MDQFSQTPEIFPVKIDNQSWQRRNLRFILLPGKGIGQDHVAAGGQHITEIVLQVSDNVIVQGR